ncbi:MAG: chromate transporter [Candidatus Eremiobacteraeota bacterium]|nr:chromate transporter [Candidatus Eremiobacteraeota bacterium]
MNQIPSLIAVFAYISLLTVGGGMAAYPEMQTLTVHVHNWLTDAQLVHFYSIGQMAPGPNMNMVAAVGEFVAGPLGALAVLLAVYAPTGLLTLGVGRLWTLLANWPWRDSIQHGLAPVALGLMLAGAITFGKTSLDFGKVAGELVQFNIIAAVIAAAMLALVLRTKINPALLILACGIVGAIAFRSP